MDSAVSKLYRLVAVGSALSPVIGVTADGGGKELRRRISAVRQKKGGKWGAMGHAAARWAVAPGDGHGDGGAPPPVAALRSDHQPCGPNPVGARALPAPPLC